MWRKLSWNVKTGRIMDVVCLKFHGENFHGWQKNCKIRESFLLRKFPAIYTVLLLLLYTFYTAGEVANDDGG